MRPKDLLELPAIWRTMRSPLRYLLGRARDTLPLLLALRGGFFARLRPASRDSHVFHRVFVSDEYGLRGLDLADRVVVDVGAHGGFFALRAAIAGARVVCAEPAPDNCRLLREQLELNGIGGRVSLYSGAIAANAGPGRLDCTGDPYSYALTDRPPPGRRTIPVECATLADLFEKHRVDRCALLKIDCEGSEYEILRSAPRDVLARCERVRLELHFDPGDPGDPGAGERDTRPAELRGVLEAAGLRVELWRMKRHGRQAILFCSRVG